MKYGYPLICVICQWHMKPFQDSLLFCGLIGPDLVLSPALPFLLIRLHISSNNIMWVGRNLCRLCSPISFQLKQAAQSFVQSPLVYLLTLWPTTLTFLGFVFSTRSQNFLCSNLCFLCCGPQRATVSCKRQNRLPVWIPVCVTGNEALSSLHGAKTKASSSVFNLTWILWDFAGS